MEIDLAPIWVVIQDIQKHTSTMNSELSAVQVDITWLKRSFWELMSWIRIITGGIIVGIILSIWNLIIVKRNGKR